MTQTILTSTAVTREALRVLHQKLNFIGRVNRQYDDSFADEGAKIGDSLKIRLPNQYTVTTGRVMSVQDTAETSTTLQISTQQHVAMNFTSNELTLSLDDFSKRIIQPAMAVLAAKVESTVISNVYKDVYQQVNNVGSTATFNNIVSARKKLVDSLTPQDDLTCTMATQTNVDLVDTLKGLFHDQTEVAKQYREGLIGRTSGFTFFENTHAPNHTSGTDTSAYTVNGTTEGADGNVTLQTGSGTFKVGDIVTFAGCNDVHPETKVSTGRLKQFVVTANYTSGDLAISPSIITSGPTQNVSGYPTGSGAVTKVGGNAATYDVNLAFHRDAFTFATADLIMPKGIDFGARETMDGIRLRIVRQYDINNDNLPCRVDILYGYKTMRPQLACRIATNS